METDRKRTVVKLGGSLFDSPSWPARLRNWLVRQPIGDYFMIVGGGVVIDALRELDTCHRLNQCEMHWRCIQALDLTFEIASELTPDFGRIASLAQLRSKLETEFDGKAVRIHWVRIASYYCPEFDEGAGDEPKLELGWNTTSDSLALLLASRIRAERCVLLKSCEVKHLKTLQQAVDARIIDSESIRFQALVPAIEFEKI